MPGAKAKCRAPDCVRGRIYPRLSRNHYGTHTFHATPSPNGGVGSARATSLRNLIQKRGIGDLGTLQEVKADARRTRWGISKRLIHFPYSFLSDLWPSCYGKKWRMRLSVSRFHDYGWVYIEKRRISRSVYFLFTVTTIYLYIQSN